jgi:hypothetical protein
MLTWQHVSDTLLAVTLPNYLLRRVVESESMPVGSAALGSAIRVTARRATPQAPLARSQRLLPSHLARPEGFVVYGGAAECGRRWRRTRQTVSPRRANSCHFRACLTPLAVQQPRAWGVGGWDAALVDTHALVLSAFLCQPMPRALGSSRGPCRPGCTGQRAPGAPRPCAQLAAPAHPDAG